jgi:hypothetical protein
MLGEGCSRRRIYAAERNLQVMGVRRYRQPLEGRSTLRIRVRKGSGMY